MLSGVRLGYKIYDNCGTMDILRAALSLVSGLKEEVVDDGCIDTETVPSDYYQSKALAKLVRHFGWTWVGAVAVDNEYGLNGIVAFIQAAEEYGNITGLQWIGSDAWITDSSLTDSKGHTILLGSLGFTVTKADIPGLEEYLRQLHPSQFPNSQFVKDFWEEVFDCSLNETVNTQRQPCNGFESLQTIQSQFTDVSELRFTKNVYKSVFAVAHALDIMTKCNDNKEAFSNRSCFDPKNIQTWQVPVSVCSKKCLPGTYKVLQKGKPTCCHDCMPCPAGEITNLTESLQCLKCPPEYWSNNKRDACIPKPVEFLAYNEILGKVLAICSLLGIFLTMITTLIFFTYKETPLVRANNSELSFLLLFSLTLCFLCSLTFMGRPTEWSCKLRHTAFGITFVL
ncbi:hypothetical protein CRENBAI_012962, partial [Crenichthys baileyi]